MSMAKETAAAPPGSPHSSYGSVDNDNGSLLVPSRSPAAEEEPRQSSCLEVGAVANLCSATLGAGVLALPYALREAGLVWGGILLVLAATSTLYSLQLLVQACEVLNLYTYESIVQQILGKRARTITEISILLFCGGCAVAYIITIGDILQSLGLSSRKLSMVFVWCVAMVPLSLLRKMTSLQSASGVGIFSIGMLVLVANVHFLEDYIGSKHSLPSLESLLWPSNGIFSVLQACPLVLFAFSCQVNVCAIYHELDDKPHMFRVLSVAVGVCGLLYVLISLAAYLDFHENVQPNVLQNYCPSSSLLLELAFGGMTVAVVMAFPLNIFPTRVTLEGLLWKTHDHVDNDVSSEVEMEDTSEPLLSTSSYDYDYGEETPAISPTRPFSRSRHVLLTLGITLTVLMFALVAPNITVVFGLLGGTTSSIIGFILPGMIGIKILPQHKRWMAKLLVVGGIVIAILTTAVTVYTTFVPNFHSNHTIPNPCNTTNEWI